MKLITICTIFFALIGSAQKPADIYAKIDSVSGKYGFVDSTGEFVIKPVFDYARNFMDDYTSVLVDSLWGIIDVKGEYKTKPKYAKISAIYKGHFIESGANMKFRSLNGNIIYEYLFIPGPFKEINDLRFEPKIKEIEDGELMLRVLEFFQITICHQYERNRIYNFIALDIDWALKMTIDFVLANPQLVKNWIDQDKEFEKAYENGEIDCCGHGPVWYR